jgi:predicted metal-dependent hydrolase
MKGEKIYHDPEIGEVTFRKSIRSRSIGIRVHPLKGVSVSVPYIVPYAVAQAFFQSRRGWVLETMARQKEKYKDVVMPTSSEIESLRKKAKAELPPRLAELAARYGFTYNRVAIKHNASNWGSCSSKGNLNFNCLLLLAPPEVLDCIVVHELCHRKQMNHSSAFYAEVLRVMPDYHTRHAWLKKNGTALMGRVNR